MLCLKLFFYRKVRQFDTSSSKKCQFFYLAPMLDLVRLLCFCADLKDIVYLPYAKWLQMNDRFDEARIAYRSADRPDQATYILEQLTYNAVIERRFSDASFYFYQVGLNSGC